MERLLSTIVPSLKNIETLTNSDDGELEEKSKIIQVLSNMLKEIQPEPDVKPIMVVQREV